MSALNLNHRDPTFHTIKVKWYWTKALSFVFQRTQFKPVKEIMKGSSHWDVLKVYSDTINNIINIRKIKARPNVKEKITTTTLNFDEKNCLVCLLLGYIHALLRTRLEDQAPGSNPRSLENSTRGSEPCDMRVTWAYPVTSKASAAAKSWRVARRPSLILWVM